MASLVYGLSSLAKNRLWDLASVESVKQAVGYMCTILGYIGEATVVLMMAGARIT
jgi:hypothetical protein